VVVVVGTVVVVVVGRVVVVVVVVGIVVVVGGGFPWPLPPPPGFGAAATRTIDTTSSHLVMIFLTQQMGRGLPPLLGLPTADSSPPTVVYAPRTVDLALLVGTPNFTR
jgi:hypothetical protein